MPIQAQAEESCSSIDLSFFAIENKSMAQTVEQFLNVASKLISDADGSATNLQSFLDGLVMINNIRGEHKNIAVPFITTRLITNENTIDEMIAVLKNSINGDSLERKKQDR